MSRLESRGSGHPRLLRLLLAALVLLVRRVVAIEIHGCRFECRPPRLKLKSSRRPALLRQALLSCEYSRMPLDEDEEESPLPAARVVGRLSAASLKKAAGSPKPRPNHVPKPRPAAARQSKAELMARAQQVDRMAAALNANRATRAAPPKPVVSPPAHPPTELAIAANTPSPAQAPLSPLELEVSEVAIGESEAEEVAGTELGLSEHLSRLSAIAVPPPGGSAESAAHLQSALADAAASLSACEQQQTIDLQRSVDSLKSGFRARLEALEAEFVRRAQALSDELANAVAERKHECVHTVAAQADQLAASLTRLRDGAAGGDARMLMLEADAIEADAADEAVPPRALLPKSRARRAKGSKAAGWESSEGEED